MIAPGNESLSRRPFVTPRRRTVIGRAFLRRDAGVSWCRACDGRAPFRGKEGYARARDAVKSVRSPVRHAYSFLREHARPLGISDPGQLVTVRMVRSSGGTHVRFQQTIGGAAVIGSLLDVHMDQRGEICMVRGGYHRGIRLVRGFLGASPVTKAEAIRRAWEDLGPACHLKGPVRTGELILPRGRKGYRVYKVVLPAERPRGTWVYLISVISGEILKSYNMMRFEGERNLQAPRGKIYLSNPAEDAELHVMPLERLDEPSALAGSYVAVKNEDSPEAFSSSGAFIYSPLNTHFDEVMVYYHVDRAGDYFREIDPGVELLMEQRGCRLHAHVHAGERMDNAYFEPVTHSLYFGDGGGFLRLNDLAREAAIIYHEYTHALLHAVNPHLKGEEADALHEGYADYFGCSLTNDGQIGEWTAAARGEACLRDCTNDKRYPDDLRGEPHADGEIWSGFCWDLRRVLGARMADRIVYESMHFLPEFARMNDAARGCAQATENICGGGEVKMVKRCMRRRGLK